jgi:hypothetical protein
MNYARLVKIRNGFKNVLHYSLGISLSIESKVYDSIKQFTAINTALGNCTIPSANKSSLCFRSINIADWN